MMKVLLTHLAIVLIISIDQHFPCEAHTHDVTLLGWGTYEEKITGFELKKRKRDEASNMEARAGNAYEGARYEAESKSGKLASGDSASWRMETNTTSVVSSLISHYNGLSLGSNKSGGAYDTRS
ncbi:hypothetical protein D8674_008397 [Pyrus ussuriensis x Pyrus communis]|uniref:Uncharacterized protein n=1 Tax=Pyrus ussuriensis x Pyrus communis TaxID=2448454 RepID=A0A5N5HTK1_9ROSA|nr:hypothetical protein D8674_008397 [Pyrus ussuriensis x Pyrus communis]